MTEYNFGAMCTTRVCIEGNKNSIESIVARLDENKRMETDIFAPLGLSKNYLMCTDCWNAEVMEMHGKSYLSLWFTVPEREDRRCWEKANLPSGVYYMTGTTEQAGYITNNIDRKLFKELSVVLYDDCGEEVYATFGSEAEAVRFIKGACRQISYSLETVDQIFDFFEKREHEAPQDYIFYGLKECCPVDIGLACAPITARIIQCLYDAINTEAISK